MQRSTKFGTILKLLLLPWWASEKEGALTFLQEGKMILKRGITIFTLLMFTSGYTAVISALLSFLMRNNVFTIFRIALQLD